MDDKERQEYERLLREQEIKTGKMPLKAQLKMDFQVLMVLIMAVSYIAAKIIRAMQIWGN